jgi:Fe-S-cluster containining protein
MNPPIRKKSRPYTKDETNYISTHCTPESAKRILSTDEEYDLPANDKLEKEIEETFKVIAGKPLDVYKRFIKLTDEFNILYKKFSPCKKGCGTCCSIAVHISELEKNIIKKYLEENNEIKYYKYNRIPKEPIFKNGIPGGNYRGQKCPFLENNECKIYSARPYRCRSYISVDDNCVSKFEKDYKREVSEEIITIVMHLYSEIYYERIIKYYYNKKNISDIKLNDIRDFFEKL